MMGYVYDAEGHRVAKGTITTLSCDVTTNGFTLTNSYVVGARGEQVSELNGSGQPVHSNVFANGELLATYTTTDTQFALADWLGTKRVVLGASGCGTTFTQYPYGDALATNTLVVNGTTLTQCSDATEHHYTGKERDTESGLDYFGARYYASNMGRWMSPDWADKPEPVPYSSLDNPQSLNLYGYVLNNPLSKDDPDGHCCEWAKQKIAEGQQWAADHPRTMSAVKAGVTAVATVGVVVAIVATAPVSVPATLGAAAVTGLTTAAATITATGGAVATVAYATGAITGDTKNTSEAADAVQTVTNPVGLAVAIGSGGNMDMAGKAGAVSDLLTGGKDALTHVDKDVSAMGSAASAAVHAGGAATAVPAAQTLTAKPEKKDNQ